MHERLVRNRAQPFDAYDRGADWNVEHRGHLDRRGGDLLTQHVGRHRPAGCGHVVEETAQLLYGDRHVRTGDERAASLLLVQQTFRDQLPECLPDGRAGHREHLAQRGLRGDELARLPLSLSDSDPEDVRPRLSPTSIQPAVVRRGRKAARPRSRGSRWGAPPAPASSPATGGRHYRTPLATRYRSAAAGDQQSRPCRSPRGSLSSYDY